MKEPTIIQSTDNIEQDLQRALSNHASRLAKKSETGDHYLDLVSLTKSYKLLKDTKTNPLADITESQLQQLFIEAVNLLPVETKREILQLLLEDPDLKLLTEGKDGT